MTPDQLRALADLDEAGAARLAELDDNAIARLAELDADA